MVSLTSLATGAAARCLLALILLLVGAGLASGQPYYVSALGDTVTLSCPYCPVYGYSDDWLFNDKLIAPGSSNTDRFNASCDPTIWQCLLTIVDVRPEDAGLYHCCAESWQNYDSSFYADLVVIVKPTYGHQEPDCVVGDDNVTLACCVEFAGPTTVSLAVQWTDDTGMPAWEAISDWQKNISDVYPQYDATIYEYCSQLEVTVSPGIDFLPVYTCTTISLQSASELYSWNSTATAISHCPTDVTINPLTENFTIDNTLTCTSTSSNPPATYQWTVSRGRGVATGNDSSRLVIASSGFFDVTCAASILENSSPDGNCYCQLISARLTGFAPARLADSADSACQRTAEYRSAAIGLGVVFALAMLAHIAVIIFCLCTHNPALGGFVSRLGTSARHGQTTKTPNRVSNNNNNDNAYVDTEIGREPSAIYDNVADNNASSSGSASGHLSPSHYEGLQHRGDEQVHAQSAVYEGLEPAFKR